jgi:hypothetical protein
MRATASTAARRHAARPQPRSTSCGTANSGTPEGGGRHRAHRFGGDALTSVLDVAPTGVTGLGDLRLLASVSLADLNQPSPLLGLVVDRPPHPAIADSPVQLAVSR